MRNLLYILLVCSVLLPARGYGVDRNLQTWLAKKPPIKTIEISGNQVLKETTVIRDAMYSKERNAWRALKGTRQSRVQGETLDRDTLEIMYLYLTRGFLDVKVQESFRPVSEKDSSAVVVVKIDEGRRYFYGDKRIAGTYPPRYHGYFTKFASRLKRDHPINPFDIRAVVVEMKTILSNNGYPYANIQFDYDKSVASDTIPIAFTVAADTLVHFGDISIKELKTGARRIYPEYVIKRELTFKPGEIYKQSDLVQSRKRLYESGYFSYVQLIPDDSLGTRIRPDMVVQLRETRPRYFSLTAGAGQSTVRDLQWDISMGGGKRNFFGSRHLDVLSDLSFGLGQDARVIAQSNRIRYTEPWFLGLRMPLALTGQYQPPLRFVQQKFIKISSWSLTASTSKRFGEQVTVTGGVEYNKVRITGVPPTEADSLKQAQGISVRRDFYSNYVVDSRDNPFIPARGQYTTLSGQFFGGFLGGDDDFYKFQASWSTYQIVWPGWIYAVRLKGGWVKSFGKTAEVPKDELFYLGGAGSIRGFKENSLGPTRADGSAEGANYIFIFNQEFRWKTLQIFSLISGKFSNAFPQWQSIFFDIGNGYRNLQNITPNSLAISYGTGFQIVSPAGPIRLDYAISVRTPRYNVAPRFHFTILYAF